MTCWIQSGDVFDGMSSVRDNACVNYDVTTVEVNTSSNVSTGNINCDLSMFKLEISAIMT